MEKKYLQATVLKLMFIAWGSVVEVGNKCKISEQYLQNDAISAKKPGNILFEYHYRLITIITHMS